MNTVCSFVQALATFKFALTAPTAENLAVLARGAVLAEGARTVGGCLKAARPWVRKHWTAYSNLLRRARMNTLVLARTLFCLVLRLLPEDSPIYLVVDETLVRRWGPKVVGVSMHRDQVRCSRARNSVSPGHKWVVLSVVLPLPYVRYGMALPVLSALYSTRKKARRNRAAHLYRRHRTPAELALLLVRILVRWAPGRRFLVVGDGTYANHRLASAFRGASRYKRLRRVRLVSRFRMDAVLYDEPPEYCGRGRPPQKGERLPAPGQVAAGTKAGWQRAVVQWYGGEQKVVWLCSRTGLWYRSGEGAKWVRWVVVRYPEEQRDQEVFFTTDRALSPQQIVETYVRRWPLETAFQETREHLGLETLRNRCALSIKRSVPFLLGLYSFIVVWFACHVREPRKHLGQTPWYKKRSITFSDMLMAARQDILWELFSATSPPRTADHLIYALRQHPPWGLQQMKPQAA